MFKLTLIILLGLGSFPVLFVASVANGSPAVGKRLFKILFS